MAALNGRCVFRVWDDVPPYSLPHLIGNSCSVVVDANPFLCISLPTLDVTCRKWMYTQ